MHGSRWRPCGKRGPELAETPGFRQNAAMARREASHAARRCMASDCPRLSARRPPLPFMTRTLRRAARTKLRAANSIILPWRVKNSQPYLIRSRMLT